MYFYQCTECRRCSLFAPYGIDTAEITMMARELLHLVGCNINWILEPAANCNRTGNHLGIQPHAYKDMMDFLSKTSRTITGIHIEPTLINEGRRDPLRHAFRRHLRRPGIDTYMGYIDAFP